MLQTLPSRRTDTARPASPATGAYKVDISRGERIGRVSSEWFSRPDDERYLSLGALHAAVRARAERATARTVETKALRVEASRDDAERLSLIVPGQDMPVAPTHWSYGQLCSLVGAPASYMRQLPAPLAGINLQHGLLSHRAELVKTLEADDGRMELRAVTGPDYGRIWDHELVEAVMRIAGDGTGDTRWKVPGLLDWSTSRSPTRFLEAAVLNITIPTLPTTAFVKDIGHRQMYDILQSRKPRVTGGELWGFRVWP